MGLSYGLSVVIAASPSPQPRDPQPHTVPSEATANDAELVAVTLTAVRPPGKVTCAGLLRAYREPRPVGPGVRDPQVHTVPSVPRATTWELPIAVCAVVLDEADATESVRTNVMTLPAITSDRDKEK